MKLIHQEQIDNIEGCPLKNEAGTTTLYRFVKTPIDESSFIAQSILLKPKYDKKCEAWGLSTFKSNKTSEAIINSMAKNLRRKYNNVASIEVDENDGVKYQSGPNKDHYTFFPNEDLDLITKFVVKEDE